MDKNSYCRHLSYLAHKAILYEVSATPKPGLVDRMGNGAHNDMDFFTFMASAAALDDVFYQCAEEGMYFAGDQPSELLAVIRPIGLNAEKRMFEATKGINTHKGIIFSLGLVCAAAALVFRDEGPVHIEAETVCTKVSEITKGICDRELDNIEKKDHLTTGERLFSRYNLRGIRGEVESGFRTVRETGLVEYKILSNLKDVPVNDKLVQILMSIMTAAQDTNVVGRHYLETLDYVRGSAKEFIDSGGIFSKDAKMKLEALDRDFSSRRISPGGSADLLAVTVMLGMIEGIEL